MGAIIAAIIAALGTVVATSLTNEAIDDANEQGLKLANISRQDELNLQLKNERLTKAQLKLQKKQLAYQRESELFGRKERAEERGYVRRERQFDKQLGIVNRNDAMRNQLVNVWRKAA